MDIEDIESVTLVEFSSLYKRIERGEWLMMNPVWVERPSPKE